MNLSIIRPAYDIRGSYPDEINEAWVYLIAKAVSALYKPKTVIIGRDVRLSSPDLVRACIDAFRDSGVDALYAGVCGTEMITFATGNYDRFDMGVMITASHCPKHQNGMKICFRGAVPMPLMQDWQKIREIIEKRAFFTPETLGLYEEIYLLEDWTDFMASFLQGIELKPLRIVVDAGNAVAGKFMPLLAEKIGIDIVPLYFEGDGNFPHHDPDPLVPKNMADLCKKVREERADFGIAFDGDADRISFCDEGGNIIQNGVISSLIIEEILKKYPNSDIIYNAVTSDIVKETIEKMGGSPLQTKVGYVYLKEVMHKNANTHFWCEQSAHYFFRESWCTDSAVLALIYVLKSISKTPLPLSRIVAPYQKYTMKEGSIRLLSAISQEEIQKKLVSHYPDAQVSLLDGVTLRLKDAWINVRPSTNEPLLRIIAESQESSVAEAYLMEVLEVFS